MADEYTVLYDEDQVSKIDGGMIAKAMTQVLIDNKIFGYEVVGIELKCVSEDAPPEDLCFKCSFSPVFSCTRC